MIEIKAYTTHRYYLSKYGEKQYIGQGGDDNTLLAAAMLTGKGIQSEEVIAYIAYGETKEEAGRALDNFIKANPSVEITRKEYL